MSISGMFKLPRDFMNPPSHRHTRCGVLYVNFYEIQRYLQTFQPFSRKSYCATSKTSSPKDNRDCLGDLTKRSADIYCGMQNYDNQEDELPQRSVRNESSGSIRNSVKPIWNVLYFKVSSAGKQTRRCFNTLCTADFQSKISQDAMDCLNRHSSVGHAIKTTVKFAAMFILCGVAIEFFHHLRPIYWMVVNFFISALNLGAGMVFVVVCFFCSCLYASLHFLLIFTIRLTSGIFAIIGSFFIILWALLKFLVKCLSGVVAILLFGVWALDERKRLSKSKRNERKQKPHTSTGLRKTVICPASPLGNCTEGLDCNSMQFSMPYCWQFKKSDSYFWRKFGPCDNVAIETLYCDVENLEVKMVLKDTYCLSKGINVSSTMTANFEKMSMQFDTASSQFSLSRCSTPSYIQEPGNVLSTKWTWYWEDNDGWKKYAETKQSSGTKQEHIEAAYVNKDPVYFFRIGTSSYKIKFNKASMYQRSMDQRYLTKRRVRRRPLFVSESVVQTSQSDLMCEDIDSERIPMPQGSEEFESVSKLFHETIPEWKASILIVEKITNGFLRERYNRKREQMKKKLKVSNYDEIEKFLFHGTTSDVIDAICKQNFDHRLRGKNGTRYGEGSYFAVAASYSNNYSSQSGEKTRFMFLVSVLTGDYKLGGRDLRRPPLKDPSNPASDLYDSCVDNENKPKIFVIFNDEQCYPLYLIKYRLREP